jgi:hypothetical protein
VQRLVKALDEEIARALRDPATTREEAYAELTSRVGNAGSRIDFDAAWSFMDVTSDPLPASIATFASRAAVLGFVPPGATIAGLLP